LAATVAKLSVASMSEVIAFAPKRVFTVSPEGGIAALIAYSFRSDAFDASSLP
jgi:hypothetical protein